MVSIFTVYNHRDKVARYVIANEEGFNVQTIDTVSCEREFDDSELDDIILENHDWSALTCEPAPWDMLFEDEEWKLYKYCQFEFYKRDCLRFKHRVNVPVQWLPPELYDKLTTEAKDWLMANDVDVETDGNDVWLPEAYTDYREEQLQKQLQGLKDFKEWLDNLVSAEHPEEDIERLYNETFKLSFNGREVELDFDADNYSHVSDLLQAAIDNF